MIPEYFVIVGAFINLLGGASYIRDTVQGKVKPNRVSWGLWTVAVMVAFSAEVSQGIGILSLATFTTGFVPLLIFIASFANKKSYWKLTKFDMFCGALSVVGLILWYVTKIGNIAIAFSIFADFAAGIPTLVKAWKYPETESWVEFLSSFINVTIAMLTIKVWTFAHYAFPMYIFLFDIIAVVFIKFRLGKRLNLAEKSI